MIDILLSVAAFALFKAIFLKIFATRDREDRNSQPESDVLLCTDLNQTAQEGLYKIQDAA
jgi:hypothetical protein